MNFKGNLISEEELEWQRDRILKAPLVIRYTKYTQYPISEDLNEESSMVINRSFPVLARVLYLTYVLHLGGSSELVHQVWSQFTLTAARVNVDLKRSRDAVPISISFVPCFNLFFSGFVGVLFQSITLNGMYSRILSRVLNWAKIHGPAVPKVRAVTLKFRFLLKRGIKLCPGTSMSETSVGTVVI